MSLIEINKLNSSLSNDEKFIHLASNPDYKTDTKFLNKWIDKKHINIEHESSFINEYGFNGPKGETPLIRAIRTGNLSFIELLITKGVDLNHARPSDLCTPLMIAAHYVPTFRLAFMSPHMEPTNKYSENGLKIISLLISLGADINQGHLLHFWQGRTDNDVFNYIIDRITNVNATPHKDKSNLFTTQLVENLSLEQYKKLHHKGVDIHCLNTYNHNPFFIAAVADRIDIVKYLLQFDVDLNVVSTFYKQNVIEYLKRRNKIDILNIIKAMKNN